MEHVIHGPALMRILRVDGRAANQIAKPISRRVLRDAAPEQRQDLWCSVFTVDGGATKFQYIGTQRLIGLEMEYLLRIVAQAPRRALARLHSIGADDTPCQFIFNQQVIAKQVELIRIHPGTVRVLETLTQLNIKNLESQPACFIPIVHRLCEAKAVTADLCTNKACWLCLMLVRCLD